MEIKVFGQTAKEIKPGDIFIAVCGSVEGRTVVTLVKKNVELSTNWNKLIRKQYGN